MTTLYVCVGQLLRDSFRGAIVVYGIVLFTQGWTTPQSGRFAVLPFIIDICFTFLDKNTYYICLDREFKYVSFHIDFEVIIGIVVV